MPRHHVPAQSPVAAATPTDRVAAAAAQAATTSDPLRPPGRPRRWHWAALIGILLLAAGLRVHGLTLNGLWIDELYSLEFSTGAGYANLLFPPGRIVSPAPHLTRLDQAAPVYRVWGSLRDDPHPPLYYLTLRLWREAFGSSDAAIRSLSLVASLVAIALLFDLGRLLFSPAPGLWAALIMAIAHPQIWYAQEARGYTMLAALAIGACVAVVRIERLGFTARRAWALAGCLVGAMLTHYFAAVGCLAIGFYVVVRFRGPDRRRALAVMAAAAAVYLVIWGPFFLQQLTGGFAVTRTWMNDAAPAFFPRWAGRVLLAPIRLLSRPSTGAEAAGRVAAVLLVLPFLLLRRRPGLLLPALTAVAWIGGTALADLLHTSLLLEHERFYLTAAPFLYLTAAGLLAGETRPWLRHAVPACLVLYCALSFPWIYLKHRAEWRDLGAEVARNAHDGDLIIYHTPAMGLEHSGTAYLAVDHYATSVATRALFLPAGERPAPDVLAQVRAARAVWLITDVSEPDLSSILPGYTINQSHLAVSVGYVCRLVPPDAPATAPAEQRQQGGS